MSNAYDVLVVEDELPIRNLIAMVLERDGLRVKTTAGAFEALHWLETQAPPRVILLDLGLGMTQGRTLRQRQREDSRLSRIPVILVSGSDSLELQARELAVNEWLSKPIDIRRLRELVLRHCRSEPALTRAWAVQD